MAEKMANATIPRQSGYASPRKRYNVLVRASSMLDVCTYVSKAAKGGPTTNARRRQPKL
jgi:hypothetical protein